MILNTFVAILNISLLVWWLCCFIVVGGNHLEDAVWKLDYYEWAMQIFEQYNISDGACQFALAALEQVEEAFLSSQNHPFDESATAIKGRLWANVFKFTLDLRQFYEAYCAIISNPDEESKNLCLRRFIIVLYEGNAIKVSTDHL